MLCADDANQLASIDKKLNLAKYQNQITVSSKQFDTKIVAQQINRELHGENSKLYKQ